MNKRKQKTEKKRGEIHTHSWVISRKEFLKASGGLVASLSLGNDSFAFPNKNDPSVLLRFGMVTDLHYAARVPNGSRHYKESLTKLKECVDLMNEKKVDFLIELGDFKDQQKKATEKSSLSFLQRIEAVYSTFKGPRYHVLGNHDMDSLSKQQFLDRIENTGVDKGRSYYSFDSNGLHFVVLDANYKADGTSYDHGKFNWRDACLPKEELDWLKKDLTKTSKPVVVFVHQPIGFKKIHLFVINGEAVRQILTESKKVLAVFQGHYHSGGYSYLEGIHYYTLKALVEGSGEKNNAYAIVEIHKNHNVGVTGYRRVADKIMPT